MRLSGATSAARTKALLVVAASSARWCSSTPEPAAATLQQERALKRGTRGKIVREVDPRGFFADIHDWNHLASPETTAHVRAALKSKENMLFCGSQGTGKLTVLRAIGEALRDQQGLEVAFTSFDPLRAHRLDGILVHHLLGIRVNSDELPVQEQLEGTLERHVRLVSAVYENAVHSIATCDAIILDSLHLAPCVILRSLDVVCRRVRGNSEPFGGLRVIASADFWAMNVHPGSDTGGYIFQLPEWDYLFPKQLFLPTIYGQEKELGRLTDAALMGTLTNDDIATIQSKSNPMTAKDQHSTSDHDKRQREESRRMMTPMLDASKGQFDINPRFPKQPFTLHNPPKAVQIKRVEIGNFLINMLYTSAFAERYGMLGKLKLEVGNKAHLVYPLLKRAASNSASGNRKETPASRVVDIPAGVVGEVVRIHEHRITMLFPTLQRTVDIPRVRVTTYHSEYPEVRYHTEQFPLYPRTMVMPRTIIRDQRCRLKGFIIDGRRMADTNDLGNILSKVQQWSDFQAVNIKDFWKLEGVVHEPTRIYYSKLRSLPVSRSAELWCKNCKGHVASKDFHDHWKECIRSVRWCSECDATVPLSKLEAHMEKHQVVLCIDCGQPIEWKNWEAHRLACGPMMRELSSDNDFLPDVTRRIAVELGLDKRDLHTVKQLSKSVLPKSKKEVYGRAMQSLH
jgi:energy-coupling factor transporter ATP-binding protein EcfA2